MKPAFCFIDDAVFELENFARNAAWAFARVDFVYARTFDEALSLLKGRRPLCFLLDIYGENPSVQTGGERFEANSALAVTPETPDLKRLYKGCDLMTPEGANSYLRGLYAGVNAWQRAFGDTACILGQGRAYGLANLKAVLQAFPFAGTIAYSRKAQYADAAELSLAGAQIILQKPQGVDDNDIARSTSRQAPALAAAAYEAVSRRLLEVCAPLGLRLSLQLGDSDLGRAVLDALGVLGFSGWSPGRRHREEISDDLYRRVAGQAALKPQEREAVMALAEWVRADGNGGSAVIEFRER